MSENIGWYDDAFTVPYLQQDLLLSVSNKRNFEKWNHYFNIRQQKKHDSMKEWKQSEFYCYIHLLPTGPF